MNAKDLKALEADPKAYVEALEVSHAAEIKVNIEAHADALKLKDEAHAAEIATKNAEIEQLQERLKASASEDNRGVVPGEFKLKSGKIVKFKKGFTVVRLPQGIFESADLISNKEHASIMEHLDEIGYGGFEEVESSKK